MTLELLYSQLADKVTKMRAWHKKLKERNYQLPRDDYNKMKQREREVDQILKEIEQTKSKKQAELF